LLIILAIAAAVYFGGGYHGRGRVVTERRTRVMFDTVVRISIKAPRSLDFTETYVAVWEELAAWESALDGYDSTGALFKLNSSDSSMVVPHRLAEAVGIGFAAKDSTGGAFDIRIGELTKLWDFSGEGYVPTQFELDSALTRMYSPIKIHGDTIIKSGLAPRIDVGGLAKGLAADAVAEILDTIPQIKRYLIDLGGNIRAEDRAGEPFKIGIQHPRDANKLAGSFTLETGIACATAGDYQRYFEIDGTRYHHILDPSTGKPATGCAAVTVIAPDALWADIYSTALFVMGPKEGMKFVKRHFSIKAAFFDRKGNLVDGNIKIE